MIIVGIQELNVGRLVLPGYYPTLKTNPTVLALAANISANGLMHQPVVVRSTMAPIDGIKRIAAMHQILSKKLIDVQLVDLEEGEDPQVLRVAVNAILAKGRDGELIQSMLDAKVAEIVSANPMVPLSGQGRRKTAFGLAREEVAKALGISQRSIERRIRPERPKKTAKLPVETLAPGPRIWDRPIKTMDLPVEPQWLEHVQETEDRYNRARLLLNQAAKLMSDAPGMSASAIREDLRRLASNIRQATPKSVCQWCKLAPPVRAECGRCGGLGWVGADLPVMPPHLMDTVNYQVNYRGKAVPLADFSSEPSQSDSPVEWAGVDPDGEIPDPDPNNGDEVDDWMGSI